MNEVQQLERKLADAKKQEKEVYTQNLLNNARKMVDKCYSTHLFQRLPKAGKQIEVRRIVDVNYDENNGVQYACRDISFMYYPAYNRFKFEINQFNHREAFPSYYGFSHEISLELFNTVEREITAHADGYFDKIKSIFKQSEYISIGDHNDDKNRFNWLSKYNNFIDLPSKGYESVKDILSWNNHPYIFLNQLVDSKESIEIIKDIADKIEKNARSWGGSIWERDAPRVKTLRDFYNIHIQKYL